MTPPEGNESGSPPEQESGGERPPGPGGALPQPGLRLCAAALGVVFVVLAVWTWGALADPLVDFGQQVYAPWRVAEGELLYRDVAWFLGPLSVHLHALLFALTGPSLVALNLLNLLLLAAFTAGLFALVAWLSDRTAALAACGFVLVTFGFGHLAEQGNYALAAPYAHEATHGLYLAFVTLAAAAARLATGRIGWTAVAGAAVGAAFLTKPEMFLAAAVTLVVALLATHLRPLAEHPTTRRDALAAGGAALGVLLPAWLALALRRGSGGAGAVDLAGGWLHLRAVGGSAFYASGAGLDDPIDHLGALVLAWTLVGGLFGAAHWALGKSERVRSAALLLLVFAGAGVIALRPALLPRAILPAAVALVVVLTIRLRGEHDASARPQLVVALAGACAACVLLGKQGLFPRLHHYGFVLALPAAVGVITALVHGLPARAEAAGRDGAWCRKLALYLLVFLAAALLKTTATNVATRTVDLAPGIRARTAAPVAALKALQATPPEARCLVLPEGILLNVLARRVAPSRFTKHMPHELAAFGADAALAALHATPPDLVVLLERDMSEFGAQPFGRNRFDRPILDWLRSCYELTPADHDAVLILSPR